MHRLVLEVSDAEIVKLNNFLHILPEESVKVISDEVFVEDDTPLDTLVNTIKDKKIFSSIDDSLSWQREIRDEW